MISEKIVIDNDFIKKWSPQYDEPNIGDDYSEYEDIIKKVSEEFSQTGTLSKEIFKKIYNWKAARALHYVDLTKFDDYAESIRKAIHAPEDHKLSILDDLYGIGVPVASTILHFIYPSVFPIMDIRVTQALYYNGYLKAKTITPNNYVNYRKKILDIQQESKCTLREIDTALFAYHKKKLQPELRAVGKVTACYS